jgi:AraC-like DNA-binding protein
LDPLLDLIGLLRPRAALFGAGVDAFGDWRLDFRKRDDLLFCWVEQGEFQLIRPGAEPLSMQAGDFALIHTSTPFTLASDEFVEPVDSETAVAATRKVRLRLGCGSERPVTLQAGKFLLEKANEALLTGLFPPVTRIAAADSSLARVRTLLAMNEAETRRPGPASEFVIMRLVELILIEILRAHPWRIAEESRGLLAGLADPVIAKALAAMHGEVARAWSVDVLARHCNVSRSAFASRFRAVVGMAPIDYLLNWRMALAKDALSRGTRSVGEIAFDIGFQSPSAFTTAFTRMVGCAPTRFAREIADQRLPPSSPPGTEDRLDGSSLLGTPVLKSHL